jgi:ferredoxin
MLIDGEDAGESFDLLKIPALGRLLKWRHARTAFQIPVLLLSLIMIAHGLLGSRLAPENLATNLTWIHFRGVLVLILLLAGNFFCMACPFVLVRDWARKLHQPRWNWPRKLRTKWLSVILFATILFSYEAFNLWASPWWTAWLIVLTFKHATFCKFVCPIGQFNFVASTLSPLQVKVRKQAVCDSCATKDCIRGRRPDPKALVTFQRGCELALFQPLKVGNLDCTFCLDCVQACPHDNVGIQTRMPGEELLEDPRRSGIGRLSRRHDIGALATIFVFGALINALGMVSPLYEVERWLSRLLHLQNRPAILSIVFVLVLVIEPLLLLAAATGLSKTWGGLQQRWLFVMTRYSYGLVPMGFGMWLAHYGFHLLTGLYTAIPVAQNTVKSIIGYPLFGEPLWTLVGLPPHIVQPIEYGFLVLGLGGSLVLLQQLAESDAPRRWIRLFAPWAALSLILFATSWWLLSQPMDMRATFLE